MDFKEQAQIGPKEPKKEPFFKLMQSARKCSEKITKKFSGEKSGKIPEKSGKNPVVTSQVTRKGHRPLSTLLSGTKVDKNEDSDDSDSEQERKLLRSQIIKSFWEQHDQEEDPEVGETENNSVAARWQWIQFLVHLYTQIFVDQLLKADGFIQFESYCLMTIHLFTNSS